MKRQFNDYTITVFETQDENDTIVFSVYEKLNSQWVLRFDIHYNNGGWLLWTGINAEMLSKEEQLDLCKFTREWCREIIEQRVASLN
jgi:hypothetical protein